MIYMMPTANGINCTICRVPTPKKQKFHNISKKKAATITKTDRNKDISNNVETNNNDKLQEINIIFDSSEVCSKRPSNLQGIS